jgi:Kdo2-lipid IVA lauroyltransferase/acyltransferase
MADGKPVVRRLGRGAVHAVEAVLAGLVYGLFWLLPTGFASALGGWLGRTIGPRLGITRRAARNLRGAFPELGEAQVSGILVEMWGNLGRVMGEFPHIERIVRERLEIVGADGLSAVRRKAVPCIYFSGHLGNWELFPLAARRVGDPVVQVYRPANNRLVDAMLRHVRRVDPDDLMPKGRRGARGAIAALRAGRSLGMLVDQKMNDGIPVPFFNRDAMTAPALAELALRHGCLLIPVRIERLGGCQFRLTIAAPLEVPPSGDRRRDVAAIMEAVNRLLESWIRDRPGQWLWLHRRWPDS